MRAVPWATAQLAGTLSVQQEQSLEFFSQHYVQRKLVNCSHSLPACIVHAVLEREMFILVIWKEFGKEKWVISVPFRCDYLLKMLFTPHVRLLTARQDHGRSENIM